MSGVKLEGNALGTGVFTIKSPNSNTDRTFDLPDSSGTLLNNNSDITSQVKTATNASGDAPVYSCRAWVNFNGTGTVAIRASGNVSSITDNGTGNYTVNFTTAMPDANYSVGHAVKFQAGTTLNDTNFQFINSSGNIQVFTSGDANITYDFAFVCVQVFR